MSNTAFLRFLATIPFATTILSVLYLTYFVTTPTLKQFDAAFAPMLVTSFLMTEFGNSSRGNKTHLRIFYVGSWIAVLALNYMVIRGV